MKTLFLIFASAGMLGAQEPQTALQALKVLSKSDAANLTRIVAREGNPGPERWHFIVYDGAAPRGFRECVVTGGEIVASREVSQFADRLKVEDVVGGGVLKIDSDQLAELAQEYAQVNQVEIVSLDYDLTKAGEKAVPVWKLSCLDEKGIAFGELSVTATQGVVISHDGFLEEPIKKPRKGTQTKASRLQTSTKPESAPEASRSESTKRPTKATSASGTGSRTIIKVASTKKPDTPQAGEKPWAGQRLFNRVFRR
ncbi:MAG: hypothetical protein JWL59_4096 [Chthoniobacteraceae bacterium]|nr:hypothetical protein [Chthoniobacteraceae bacterium]